MLRDGAEYWSVHFFIITFWGVDHTKREFFRQETTSGGRVEAM